MAFCRVGSARASRNGLTQVGLDMSTSNFTVEQDCSVPARCVHLVCSTSPISRPVEWEHLQWALSGVKRGSLAVSSQDERQHEGIAEDTCFLSIPPSVSFINQAPWALPLNRPACSWRQLGWNEKGAEARRNEQVPRRAKWRTGMASAWWMGWGDVKPCGFIECTLEPACSEAVDHDASDGTGIFP